MNDRIKVLVADDNAALRSRISEHLTKSDSIACCDCVSNGSNVLRQMENKEYDVVVMDVILQQLDGFGVIEAMNKMDKHPRVIVMSALSHDDIIRRACSLGAYYYLIKPINLDTLLRNIIEATTAAPAIERDVSGIGLAARGNERPIKSLDERVANIFLAVGIPAHIKGYHFLREAVKLVYSDRNIINSITKKLYPGVADIFDTSSSKVERAIRHAIEVSWSRGKIENINEIFGYTIFHAHEKPTNGEFIALIADKLLMDDLTRSQQSSAMVG